MSSSYSYSAFSVDSRPGAHYSSIRAWVYANSFRLTKRFELFRSNFGAFLGSRVHSKHFR